MQVAAVRALCQNPAKAGLGVLSSFFGPSALRRGWTTKPMRTLTDDQIWDIVRYLRSIGPPTKK